MTKVLGIVTARGGSKRIPNKNMKLLNGKPLIWYTFEAAKNSHLLDRVILSSDSDRIIKFARQNNIEAPFKRPSEFAADAASSIDVVKHTLEFLEQESNYRPDYIMILQPTSPLRTEEHIDKAINRLIDGKGDSLISVVEIPHSLTPSKLMYIEEEKDITDIEVIRPLSKSYNMKQKQELKNLYARNGAIYISSYDLITKRNRIIGERAIPFIMNKLDSIDIDDLKDFEIAELILNSKNKNG